MNHTRSARLARLTLLLAALGALATTTYAGAPAPIRVGAVFPLGGPASTLSSEELAGVDIARQLVNEDGGVAGRPIELSIGDLPTPDRAAAVVGQLKDSGVSAIIGAYSSDLSLTASSAAADAGLVYWEAGAVADRLTGRGLPGVFRVGATGSNLGSNSARFAVEQLAPRLHRSAAELRMSVVMADDEYAHSVADAVLRTARAAGVNIVSVSMYDAGAPRWQPVLDEVRGASPDILILVSHIPDGVAFRHAMVVTRLHVDAFIGSTMAECVDDFGELAGSDAVGVFASDRPGAGFDPATLRPEGRALYERFARQWQKQRGGAPTEEGLAGFSAAWTLFHEVLPRAARTGHVDASTITTAAQQVDLPDGSLPNGAGVRFASSAERLGQNLRAAAVIWQWQDLRHSVVVWPSEYARGAIDLVPLPR